MVTIDLRKTHPEDIRLIHKLKSLGIEDNVLQEAYNETIKRRDEKGGFNDKSRTIPAVLSEPRD